MRPCGRGGGAWWWISSTPASCTFTAKDAAAASRNGVGRCSAQARSIYALGRLAYGAALGPVERQFTEGFDVAAERFEAERLFAPGIVGDAEREFAGALAAGDQAEPFTVHGEELLRPQDRFQGRPARPGRA